MRVRNSLTNKILYNYDLLPIYYRSFGSQVFFNHISDRQLKNRKIMRVRNSLTNKILYNYDLLPIYYRSFGSQVFF